MDGWAAGWKEDLLEDWWNSFSWRMIWTKLEGGSGCKLTQTINGQVLAILPGEGEVLQILLCCTEELLGGKATECWGGEDIRDLVTSLSSQRLRTFSSWKQTATSSSSGRFPHTPPLKQTTSSRTFPSTGSADSLEKGKGGLAWRDWLCQNAGLSAVSIESSEPWRGLY